ncbi:MAG: FprA family A-type flavoprotein [Clostridia bacterium]|nr:FprA family A-type flavoprotein [Clostridia bacterium]
MLSQNIKYVGVNDHEIDLFEGQYVVPDGMAYNSYLIVDKNVAVIDSVDARFFSEWLGNIKSQLGEKTVDYLVVQHMEPDHSGSIASFMQAYHNAKIVSNARAFVMMKNYFGTDFAERKVVVAEGDTLNLGNHTLTFVMAPMVHWPEVMVSFESTTGTLFSADAFGKFGALDVDQEWACEARRYYIGIVGKYGVQVQALLKKASALDIQTICPLHGPILTENLGYYLNLYNIWSSYGVESEGVVIAYTSVYGNTKKAVELLEQELLELGCPKVVVNDLARCDMAEAVEDAFRYGKVVFATTTYNAEIFPFMREFISTLVEHNFQNKQVAFIENGSWAPMATKVMKGMLEKCKNLTHCQTEVKIMSAVNDVNICQIKSLAQELVK